MKITFSISCLICLSGCVLGPEKPDDQDVWVYSAPSTAGISDSLMVVLNNNIEDDVFNNINSLIVVKEDQLIFENYYDLSFRSRMRNIGQATFPILTTGLDLLQRDGYISTVQ